MLVNEWLCHQVHSLGTVEANHPDEETKSDVAPVWDEVENEAEEGLNDVEGTNNHPVAEPLLVIVLFFGLDSTDGADAWVENGVGRDSNLNTVEDEHEESEDSDNTGNEETWVHVHLLGSVLKWSDLVTNAVKHSGVDLELVFDSVHLKKVCVD